MVLFKSALHDQRALPCKELLSKEVQVAKRCKQKPLYGFIEKCAAQPKSIASQKISKE